MSENFFCKGTCRIYVQDPRCSATLHTVGWYLFTNGSGQSVRPIFKDQAVQKIIFFGLIHFFKMGPISFPQTSVTKQQSTLCNIPEERRFHLHCDRNLKLRFMCVLVVFCSRRMLRLNTKRLIQNVQSNETGRFYESKVKINFLPSNAKFRF